MPRCLPFMLHVKPDLIGIGFSLIFKFVNFAFKYPCFVIGDRL